VVFEDGVVIILRGVNLNPDSDPERMISMRLWVDQRRVISLRNSKLQVAADLFQLLKEGAGPKTTAGFLVSVVEGVCDRIAPVVDQIEAQVEDIHENTDAPGDSRVLRRQLSDIRRRAIALRRYLSPQRDMVRSLYRISNEWFTDLHRARLREAADQLMGYVEDLDATRDHAYVAQDDIQSALSDQLNRKMYILSIITGLFLPLSFLTGLLGVNVGGIPGAEDPFAFPLLCLGMGLLIGAQILLFKKLKWI
jgi:zinc transporter